MTVDNWININLIAAIIVGGGTLFLGIMAWRTIRQTRSIQKAERRERLLNEIIEWAEDILECVPEIIIPPTDIKSKDTMLGLTLINLVSKYKNVDARTEYVKGVASIFGESLKSAVEIVGQQLSEVIKFVLSHPPDERSFDMVAGYSEPLSTSTVALIKTATKIKTKDIGKKEENLSKEGEATGSDEPTLKDIENHLCQQDEKLEKGTYFSGYLFGATLIFIAFGLLAGKYILTTELWFVTYCIVILIGGIGLIGFAWYRKCKLSK